jgi:hypothetical protein
VKHTRHRNGKELRRPKKEKGSERLWQKQGVEARTVRENWAERVLSCSIASREWFSSEGMPFNGRAYHRHLPSEKTSIIKNTSQRRLDSHTRHFSDSQSHLSVGSVSLSRKMHYTISLQSCITLCVMHRHLHVRLKYFRYSRGHNHVLQSARSCTNRAAHPCTLLALETYSSRLMQVCRHLDFEHSNTTSHRP